MHRLRFERPLIAQQLVEHAPNREDVGGGRDRAVGDLFGRHVGRRADDRPGACGIRLLQPRDAEVHDLDPSVGHHAHVRWLYVAVNHAALMREVEADQHLDRDVELALQRERIAQGDHVGEIASLHQLHRDEQLALGLAEVVHGDDVGVLNGAGGPRFAQEPLVHVLGLAEARAQQLERDVAAQHRVVGLPHDAHRTFAQELVQLVLPEPAVALRGVAHLVNQSKARAR